jgi:uncharacterized SAM-binding protein YcdF (DUF218 family)
MPPTAQALNIICLILGLACLAIAIFSIKKDPRRAANGILIVLAIYLTARGALYLWSPDIPLPDGGLIIGDGSDVLFFIYLICLLLSFLTGIFLLASGARVLRKEGLNLTHFLPILFGLVGIAWPTLFFISAAAVQSESSLVLALMLPLNILQNLILYVPAMLAAFLLYSLVYAALPKPKNRRFIIVLGTGLREDGTVSSLLSKRLDRALKYYITNSEKSTFIVSGGQGPDEITSEAFAMRQYLLDQGIPKSRIITEAKSTSTFENLQFSKQIIKKHESPHTAMIVTSNYHVLRAVTLARTIGLNAGGIGGKTKFYYLPAAFLREYVAVIFSYKYLTIAYICLVIILCISRS